MKKIFLAGFAVALTLTVFCHKSFSQQKVDVKVKVKVEHDDDDDGNWSFSRNGHAPGEWDAIIKDKTINIQFYGRDWNNGRNFDLADFGALPTDKIGEFTLTRESGKMAFKGVFLNHFGHGTYSFEENAPFKAYLQQKGYTGLDQELMMSVFFTDISKSYFEFLKENGYSSVSNSQFKDLAEQNLTRKVFEDYFALFKPHSWGHPSLDKIVELREHGVNSRFVNSFAQMGYKENIPMDKALELRDHGVTPEFITSIQKMGYGSMTLDKATELRDHGVNPEFIEEIQKMGYGKLTLDKAQELRDHGVNPEFIKSIAALGFKDLSLDKAQELRDHGVNAEFIKKMRNKGVKVETLDDFIRLRDTGFSE